MDTMITTEEREQIKRELVECYGQGTVETADYASRHLIRALRTIEQLELENARLRDRRVRAA